MSRSEVERFIADLKSNDALRDEMSLNASGIGSVVTFAKDKGYDITTDEARTYLEEQMGRQLSDEELDAVAGGAGGPATAVLLTQTVQTLTTVTPQMASQEVHVAAVYAAVGSQAAVVVT